MLYIYCRMNSGRSTCLLEPHPDRGWCCWLQVAPSIAAVRFVYELLVQEWGVVSPEGPLAPERSALLDLVLQALTALPSLAMMEQ